jgi:nitroimidazol reductase NimA-like FMN-containing flavoprotein (pyridoxamine 5'-phosphate oxidase superfamily)
MSDQLEADAGLRAAFAANRYMVLGTADERGNPWVSPVWFAREGFDELFWVSSPQARHSRNLAARPQVSIVIFDSQVPVGSAAAVYLRAIAQELTGAELDRGIQVFARESAAQGLRPWTLADVAAPARHRLYRAAVGGARGVGP